MPASNRGYGVLLLSQKSSESLYPPPPLPTTKVLRLQRWARRVLLCSHTNTCFLPSCRRRKTVYYLPVHGRGVHLCRFLMRYFPTDNVYAQCLWMHRQPQWLIDAIYFLMLTGGKVRLIRFICWAKRLPPRDHNAEKVTRRRISQLGSWAKRLAWQSDYAWISFSVPPQIFQSTSTVPSSVSKRQIAKNWLSLTPPIITRTVTAQN